MPNFSCATYSPPGVLTVTLHWYKWGVAGLQSSGAATVKPTISFESLRQLARPRPQPSDLSDFSLYGGMYRHVNLVYVPTVSLATVHVQTKLPSPRGPAEIAVVGTVYNPAAINDPLDIAVEVINSKGASVHRSHLPLAGVASVVVCVWRRSVMSKTNSS